MRRLIQNLGSAILNLLSRGERYENNSLGNIEKSLNINTKYIVLGGIGYMNLNHVLHKA